MSSIKTNIIVVKYSVEYTTKIITLLFVKKTKSNFFWKH